MPRPPLAAWPPGLTLLPGFFPQMLLGFVGLGPSWANGSLALALPSLMVPMVCPLVGRCFVYLVPFPPLGSVLRASLQVPFFLKLSRPQP